MDDGRAHQVDAVLDGLEQTAKAAKTPPTPPPLPPRRRPTAGKTTRTRFEGLFARDGEAAPALGSGTADEKLQALRAVLRQHEERAARVREAWRVREGEMDHLEAELARQTRRAEDAERQLGGLQTWVEAKKRELDAYQKRLTAAMSEREQVTQAALGQMAAERQRLVGEIGSANERLAEVQRLERDLELKSLENETLEQEVSELRERLTQAASAPSVNSESVLKALRVARDLAEAIKDPCIDFASQTDDGAELLDNLGRLKRALAVASLLVSTPSGAAGVDL